MSNLRDRMCAAWYAADCPPVKARPLRLRVASKLYGPGDNLEQRFGFGFGLITLADALRFGVKAALGFGPKWSAR